MFPHSRSLNNNTEMEEERRLMYVGVTRAEEQLYFTYAKRRLIYGDYRYFTPSRFLNEVPPHLMKLAGYKPTEKRTSIYETAAAAPRSTGYNINSFSKQSYDSAVTNSGGFGKNFRLPDTLRKNKVSETIKTQEVLKEKPVLKKADKPVAKPVKKKAIELFEVKTRVLHPKFGIGEIEQIVNVGDIPMYSVMFNDIGRRAIEAESGTLKKF